MVEPLDLNVILLAVIVASAASNGLHSTIVDAATDFVKVLALLLVAAVFGILLLTIVLSFI